jgi:hypothetical protein
MVTASTEMLLATNPSEPRRGHASSALTATSLAPEGG